MHLVSITQQAVTGDSVFHGQLLLDATRSVSVLLMCSVCANDKFIGRPSLT